MRYDKILFIDDMQIIYQPEDYFDNRLSYVSLTWNDSEKDWDLTTDDIYRIVRDGNYLYLLLDDDTVEENHRTTPYIDICTNQIVIKRIKNTINSMKHNEDGGYVFTHYYEYKEVYKDEKLLVYSLGDKNWYYVVLDPNVIYDSISNVDISDLLFIKNSYSIKLSGEISSIEPVWYDEREEYYIDNKEHFSRNYRGVSVNCYGSYLGSSDDDEKDMYVIKYKGGKVEFFILKDSEKKITQNDEEGKTPKKLIYIGKKQPKED